MNRRTLLKGALAGVSSLYLSKLYSGTWMPPLAGQTGAGLRFQPTWDSLSGYQVPDWYRDAKFGLWAHWGPQCQPEYGDWYAQGMYREGGDQYKYHCKKYGHPSKFGFKDVINEWKADQWDPEELVALYKKAGAGYFVALANHHDNLDLYPTKYHKWNSTRVGPRKDIIKGWADAARANGLPFGVSVHASHAWTFYEASQGADKSGPFAGISYDGKITKDKGKGTWWEGLDPRELYAQDHPLSTPNRDGHKQWNWGDGASIPSKAYMENFYKRTLALIDNYEPDLVYFDDTALPLWPVSDVGLKIAAHMYNTSIKKHGKLNAVITGKILDEQQRKCMVWDIERGQSDRIEPLPWQTDTCLGNWHYDQRVYNGDHYKSAATVIHTLCDVVSKNGNLLLSIPVRGNGTIDEKERAIVEGIASWMKVNSEAIYGSRPWTVFGEGPAAGSAAPLTAQGFNEGKGKPFSAADIRFTTKGKILYAILLGWPEENKILVKSLGGKGKVADVRLLGHGEPLEFSQSDQGLEVKFPGQPLSQHAAVLKISGAIV
ncbi:alpha-L-fucosidase [Pararcticibacter amylolyticus]|uniref:alpha-L-fucosidase n=1 Tax=Pararcticibacter amylolyticus TaxID=2173175 RepID=A0A2U2PJB0_9SPHI|nr:alpha-L-fucosidase [Pararcticibacter amylolyticus]PWG81485.1 alpha-L-fucosidase [Pararcticibacter amylolyticus]